VSGAGQPTAPPRTDLPPTVLRLSLDLQYGALVGAEPGEPPPLGVCFELLKSGETVLRSVIDSREIGVPPSFDAVPRGGVREPKYSLPMHLIDGMLAAIPERAEHREPVWLELASSSGTLPLVPWERLLQPLLGLPVLRLPYFVLPPYPPIDALDIVLCASAPMESNLPAKRARPGLVSDVATIVRRVARSVVAGLNKDAILHVFTDSRVYADLREGFVADLPSGHPAKVILYDPAKAPTSVPGATGGPGTSRSIDTPWLQWIRDEFSGSGRAVDVVHVIGHGTLTHDRGMLVIADVPQIDSGLERQRLVGAEDLTAFLTEIGALSIGFSPAPGNASMFGLRLLADQVARARPGVVLLEEATKRESEEALRDAYRFLYAESGTPPPLSPALALYCHPGQVHPARSRRKKRDLSLPSMLAAKRSTYDQTLTQTTAVLGASSWVSAAQRFLEQEAAPILARDAGPTVQSPIRDGTKAALSFMHSLLERHAAGSGQGAASAAPDMRVEGEEPGGGQP